MNQQIEISDLDLRYESSRMKSKVAEKQLLASICERGILYPLQGVVINEDRILLDGFKRYRCAKKLNISIVPFCSFGSDEPLGIIELLRISNAKSLTILEQAKLIDELKNTHQMSVAEIAGLLEKSKGWVGMRAGILNEMSSVVMNKVFNGQFPAYAYMYTLRSFMRVNGIKKQEIDDFVSSVAGKNLSVRDIEILSNAYFRGSDEFRKQIKEGNISWGLSRLKESIITACDCTQIEQSMLRDLEITEKYINRVSCRIKNPKLKSNSFYAQANLLAGGILRHFDIFKKEIKEFYDKSGQTQGDLSASRRRTDDKEN